MVTQSPIRVPFVKSLFKLQLGALPTSTPTSVQKSVLLVSVPSQVILQMKLTPWLFKMQIVLYIFYKWFWSVCEMTKPIWSSEEFVSINLLRPMPDKIVRCWANSTNYLNILFRKNSAKMTLFDQGLTSTYYQRALLSHQLNMHLNWEMQSDFPRLSPTHFSKIIQQFQKSRKKP